MSEAGHLRQERRGDVLWLTIDRQERRNAISAEVIGGISAGIAEAQHDAAIRAVVLTGAGERAFCAGGDLQSSDPFGIDFSQPFGPVAQLFRQARAATVPLVARVNGACMAGGMGLMAMCHIAVAHSSARFGLPEVSVGVFPVQVLAVLQRLLPRRALVEMSILGEPISAGKALELGLVNRVADDLEAELERILDVLRSRSPAAVRRGLYCLSQMEAMPFEQAISFAEGQIPLFALTEDAREGIAAFRDKRKPEWTGR